MQSPDPDRQPDELEAPVELVSALRRLTAEPTFVPPTLDEAILEAGRRQLVRRPRRSFGWWFTLPGLATSAALIVLMVQVHWNPLRNSAAKFAPEDINRDGQVDILDAFAMARQVRDGTAPTRVLDLNGDGVVDERDVARIVARAVSLGKGGRS